MSDYVFSIWYPWPQRNEMPEVNSRGLSAIAHFTKAPPGNADPQQVEVVYIGETYGKTMNIRKRLNLFNKAAKVGMRIHKHSGGRIIEVF